MTADATLEDADEPLRVAGPAHTPRGRRRGRRRRRHETQAPQPVPAAGQAPVEAAADRDAP